MRAFAEAWPDLQIVQQVAAQLPWGHNMRLLDAIDLKIEEFKPEFAGKMNFYLSAVDDRLRHPDDKPSIGIILCKERNKVVVEYALRDTSKPMGVAQYRLSSKLPDRLQHELPTAEELARFRFYL
jgi:nuclease YhcG-like protein